MTQLEVQQQDTRELSQVMRNLFEEGKGEGGQRIAYISQKQKGPNQSIQVRNGNDRTVCFVRGEIVETIQQNSTMITIKPDGLITLLVDTIKEFKND
jgi:hypothetical protein